MKSFVVFVVCLSLALSLAAGQTTTGYPCNVDNCQVCSFTNFCGVCNSNFILQINITSSKPYCQMVNCTVPNCLTCYQPNVCAVCNSTFYVSGNGSCLSGTAPNVCTAGCLACNATQCQLCNFGYNLQNGACFPNNGM